MSRVEGVAVCRRLSPSCRCLILHLDHVSSPRSSNRACGFPALGSHSRSCLRSREAALPHFQAFQAVALPQPLVRKAHELPRLHLVLPAQSPAQPLARVRVNGGVGQARLPQTEVVRPAEQHSVQASHHLRRGQQPVRRLPQRTDLAADTANAPPARARADVGRSRARGVVCHIDPLRCRGFEPDCTVANR